jgi:hypothetical protein
MPMGNAVGVLDDEALLTGCLVEVAREPDLCGQQGRVVGWDRDKSQWAVVFQGAEDPHLVYVSPHDMSPVRYESVRNGDDPDRPAIAISDKTLGAIERLRE